MSENDKAFLLYFTVFKVKVKVKN